MRNIEIQIDSRLEALKNNFSKRLQKSGDKPVLFRREIEVHELLFDEKKLPLNPLVSSNNRPLNDKGLKYTDGDIVRIREAYVNYIVNGAKLSDSGEWFYVNRNSIKEGDNVVIDDKGRYLKKFPPGNTEIYFYSESKIRFSYLQWLLSIQKQKRIRQEKPCPSIKRARGFCLLKLLKDENSTPSQLGQTRLKELSLKYFPDQSPQTMYNLLIRDGLTLEQAEKHKPDYEYSLILFKEITGK